MKERKKKNISRQQYDARKEFIKVFKRLANRHEGLIIWRDFIVLFACAISNALDKANYNQREELYLSTIKRYEEKEQPLFPKLVSAVILALEENPEQDFLGKAYQELRLSSRSKGQIFTPYHVCQFMSKICLPDVVGIVKEKGFITVSDPCCGAGATLIAGIHEAKRQLEKVNLNYQNHILIVAQDIDQTAGLMCYIQLSLLGVAAYIKVGDTLTEPISDEDSLENYWFTPGYFTDVWVTRRTIRHGKPLL